MSRKDYRSIAARFRQSVDKLADSTDDLAELVSLRQVAGSIAYDMAQDNPGFRLLTFMTACGFKVKS